ncbi:hypothetical protein BO78DRAFT_388050 [Aspergillus sclerotiicarbonarius CBS 121057]|uniref:Uncharacterized protein n=1 Tax=Aspergillus sclerotiicarbonarius (strain CBS 121057 / IBT 28362) TaxID=1448318 RepID=A0A319EEQ0_ASPSB|nr:hypothetical protein BO78DRAFT_388050 [Aspergillus sclerotiicarbonarius CBS 121057]
MPGSMSQGDGWDNPVAWTALRVGKEGWITNSDKVHMMLDSQPPFISVRLKSIAQMIFPFKDTTLEYGIEGDGGVVDKSIKCIIQALPACHMDLRTLIGNEFPVLVPTFMGCAVMPESKETRIADYSVFNGLSDTMKLNLVCIEAKWPRLHSNREDQLIGAMPVQRILSD